MKKYFKLLVLSLIVGLPFASCNNELDSQQNGNPTGGYEVKFTTDIISLSRTSINSNASVFEKQDAIGIFAYNNDKAVATNVKYVYDGSKWISENAIIADAGVQYQYYAYYPYQEGVKDPKSINVTVNKDQTNGISSSDLLTAQNTTSSPGAEIITLKFDHAFSLVQVDFDLGEGVEIPSITGIEMQNILPTVTADATTGNISEASGEATSIKMEKAKDAYLFRAIVPAQSIEAGKNLLSITGSVNNRNIIYEVRHDSPISYEKGKALQITVKELNSLPEGSEIKINNDIKEWTGSENNDAVVSEIPLIKPIESSTLEEVVSDTRNFNKESWFKLVQGDAERERAAFEVVNDNQTTWGKAIKMKYNLKGETNDSPKFNNSWYKAAIGYNHTEPMYVTDEIHIYKVTAKIKGEQCEGSEEVSKVAFTIKSKSSERFKYSFATTDKLENKFSATTITFTPTKADTWEEVSFYVDFKLISSTIGGGIGGSDDKKFFENASTDDYNGFDVRIYTNNPNLKPIIYVSDIKIEQYTDK